MEGPGGLVGWEQKSGLGGGGGLGIKPKLPVCQAERGLGAPDRIPRLSEAPWEVP